MTNLSFSTVRHHLPSSFGACRKELWRQISIRESLAGISNLIGIGFGIKETGGRLTADAAVRFYVKEKISHRKLPRHCALPKVIDGLATDVIVTGTLSFQARPVPLGTSVSHINGSGGSLGCVVSRAGGQRFLLSACHVIALSGKATQGDPIVEPSAPDPSATPLAVLTDFEPLQSIVPNQFDAAIGRIIKESDVTALLPMIGSIDPTMIDARLFQSVRKYGAGTGHTLGIVTDVTAQAAFTFDGDDYSFANVIQITGCGGDFSSSGDSGALVVDALSNRPLGLIIGGAGARTFVSPLRRILDRFGAQLVT